MTMTAQEAENLINLMALWDNRKTDEADIIGWLKVIGDLRYEDCEQAIITHYKTSTDRIKPAHIREEVTRIRNDRAAGVRIPDLPPGLDEAGQRAALLAARVAAGDGRDPGQAMAEAVQGHRRRELNGGHR